MTKTGLQGHGQDGSSLDPSHAAIGIVEPSTGSSVETTHRGRVGLHYLGHPLPCCSVACDPSVMTKQALKDEIRRLPIEEQIELLGDVWDEIAGSEAVPVPEWHLRELERRLADPRPQYVPWEEVRRRLGERND